jgi:hypothetical protein
MGARDKEVKSVTVVVVVVDVLVFVVPRGDAVA